ncbi:helix-turn-helix transcriptional regulator [Vibrio comitans]
MNNKVKIVNIRHLVIACALSRSTINTLMKQESFPAPIQILGRAKRWDIGEVEFWMRERIVERNHSKKKCYEYYCLENENRPLRFHSIASLRAEFDLARSTVYDMMKNEGFPYPVQLSARRVGWVESEVIDWHDRKKSKRKT